MAVADYGTTIDAAAAEWGVDSHLLAGLLQVESGGDPNAVSPAGAIGIAQFIPSTAAQYGVDPTDPKSSIYGAAHYLHDLIAKFGDVNLAVIAYNAGPGNVQKYGLAAQQVQGADPNYLQKVIDAAKTFGYNVTQTAGGGALFPGKPADTGGSAGTQPTVPFLLTDPFGGITGAIGAASTSLQDTATKIAVNIGLLAIALALIAGGFVWLAGPENVVTAAKVAA